MRKFIATGLGAITAVTTLAFAAPAAHASPVIPGICTGLPTTVAAATGALGVANVALGAAQTVFNTKNSAMLTGLTDYATAVSDWLKAVDSGGNVSLTKAIMDSRLADLATKIADWSTARVALFNADGVLQGSQASVNLLGAFQSALCP